MRCDFHNLDCRIGLGALAPGSVDLVNTSAPWGKMRDGAYPPMPWETFEVVAAEIWRVLKDRGVICWNMGDWMKRGSLSSDPMRQLLHFEALGFCRYEEIVITMNDGKRHPLLHHANPIQRVNVLSKGRPKTVRLRMEPNTHAGKLAGKRTYRQKDGSRSYQGQETIKVEGAKGCVWDYAVTGHTEEPYRSAHAATQHQQLARDLIESYSRPWDVVLDPFAGVATTGRQSILTGRQFIGYEIHEPYYRLGLARLRDARRERNRIIATSDTPATKR
jgi:DNA modification methylase